MPQRRYWNFKEDDATSLFVRWLNGFLTPGCYHGFDFNPTANMNLNLNHLNTGWVDVDDEENESPPLGILRMRQGTVIVEEDDLTLNGIGVGDSTHPRIDVVVCTHTYAETVGGNQALYSVIPGTPAAVPVPPALNSPLTQIKIGELLIPANTTALNGAGVVWTKVNTPNYAGQPDLTADRMVASNERGKLRTSSYTLQQFEDKMAQSAMVEDVHDDDGDFNDFKDVGFQIASETAANSPAVGVGPWHVMITRDGVQNGNRYQIAMQLGGAGLGNTYRRKFTFGFPGSWGSWALIIVGTG